MRRFFQPIAFVILACVPACGLAQALDVAAIDALIARTLEQKKLVGLSASVMHNGEVVLAKGYGLASIEKRDPVTEQTLFGIGSITKQFTCVLALMQADEGKLSLDDRVSKFFPDFARAADVSLLDLGQHVSGYRDYYPLDIVSPRMTSPRTAAAVARDYSKALDFEPGSRWSYSNTGYLMLSDIIERIDGASFESILERRILRPLELRHTGYELPPGHPGAATGYTSIALTEPTPAPSEAKGWLGAAGGMWSTARDLLAWDLALMDRKLLSDASYRVLTTPRRLSNGRSARYGCGLYVGERQGIPTLAHGGSTSGFTAHNVMMPTTRSAVVLLANRDFAALWELADAIGAKLMPPQPTPPAIRGTPTLIAAVALMDQMQTGEIDRARLGEEFNAYLTPERVRAISASLARLGKLKSVEVEGIQERGAMEESTIVFKYEQETLSASMYRMPDGTIGQFMITRK